MIYHFYLYLFFKTYIINIINKTIKKIFISSGTMGNFSKHYVLYILLYNKNIIHIFNMFYT